MVSTKGAISSHINRRLNISSVTPFSYASLTSIPFFASTAKASLSAAPGTAEVEFMIPILRQERDLYSSAGVDYSTIFQLLPLLINLFQLN